MRIEQSWLHHGDAARASGAPSGAAITPKFIIIHYTAGGPASGTVHWFTEMNRGVSAHCVIDRTGAVTQLVPFDRAAFHAGASNWDGYAGMNDYSVGIELANWGEVTRLDDGTFRSWAGAHVEHAEQATHKNQNRPRWWEVFPEPQVKACTALCIALCAEYDIENILGHDDVAPNRKLDPGPLFQLAELRDAALTPNYSQEEQSITRADRLLDLLRDEINNLIEDTKKALHEEE